MGDCSGDKARWATAGLGFLTECAIGTQASVALGETGQEQKGLGDNWDNKIDLSGFRK